MTEDTEHYLLHCHHFTPIRINFMNSTNSVLYNFESLSDIDKKEILLYGDPRLDNNKNRIIVEATLNTLKFLKDSLVLCLKNDSSLYFLFHRKLFHQYNLFRRCILH